MVLLALRAIVIAATFFGLAYWCLTLLCARRFLARKSVGGRTSFNEGVSILKPLCGLEPRAYDSLRSHCLQDYPDFEIVFGVKDPHDPIVPTVERLMSEFPRVRMRL